MRMTKLSKPLIVPVSLAPFTRYIVTGIFSFRIWFKKMSWRFTCDFPIHPSVKQNESSDLCAPLRTPRIFFILY
jgi:hypothetical protein